MAKYSNDTLQSELVSEPPYSQKSAGMSWSHFPSTNHIGYGSSVVGSCPVHGPGGSITLVVRGTTYSMTGIGYCP